MTMLGRLRLVRRRPSLQLSRRRRMPATASAALTSYPELSSLAPWPLTAPVGGAARAISRRALSHQPRQRLPSGRFAQAAAAEQEEEQSTAADSACAPYLSVSILCCKNDAMTLSEALLCFGASSASMDEITETNDKTCITSIFAEREDVHNCISHAVDSIGLNYVPAYEVSRIEQCNWMTNLQETFHPVEVTKGLWIVPEWRSPVDLKATNVILNPGMSFGTGDHPTTMLCLLLLHGLIKGGERVLDYGTGSGVLGIAALKVQQVEEVYWRYLDDVSVSEMDGWACLWGTKKGLKSAPSRK